MHDQGIPSADVKEHGAHLGSYLRADAAETGLNFISPQVHLLALREFLLLREDDAAVDEDRLMTNTLTSMCLVANAFGPLALDTKLATNVFRQLLPEFVHSVERIAFEHSPGRRDERFLADRTAFDVAIHVTTPDGESAIVYVEVKYSEEPTNVARWRDRYSEALKEVRLYKDPESAILRAPLIEQLMREHCVAQLAVDHGITPRAMFVGVGPRLNRRVDAAFRVYASELLPLSEDDPTRVRFQHFTLETFIDAIDVAGDRETAEQLWKRYCDFQRVYDAALAVIVAKVPGSETPNSTTATSVAKSKKRPRKAGSRTRHTQPGGQAEVSDIAETFHG
ncbi:hypothetical protein NB311A_04424 [Nitrobacter sp. Nb-311A]|nr:hypothetical protein NB311A_04424 [Nitrobacter sp. Nb-311A]